MDYAIIESGGKQYVAREGMAATDDSGLSTDEKLGVILIVGLAVGGSIAVAAACH